jgi:hypothetical protein
MRMARWVGLGSVLFCSNRVCVCCKARSIGLGLVVVAACVHLHIRPSILLFHSVIIPLSTPLLQPLHTKLLNHLKTSPFTTKRTVDEITHRPCFIWLGRGEERKIYLATTNYCCLLRNLNLAACFLFLLLDRFIFERDVLGWREREL